MDSSELEKKYVETDAGKVFYFTDHAFPNRPWIILLHGLSSNHTTWCLVVVSLRAKHYNTLLVDLRGHGYSDKTRRRHLYSFSRFSEDLNQVVQVESVDNFILVGYSFGGFVALDYALRYPKSVRGLLLISTSYVNPFVARGLTLFSYVVSFFLNGIAYLLLWQRRRQYHYYVYEKTNQNGYWFSVYEGLKTMPVAVNLWLVALMGTANFSKALRKMQVPTMVVRAKHDPFFTEHEAKEMAEALDAELVTVDHQTHFLATHAQEAVTEIILEFIAKL
ncbi:hypothetical protein COV04_01205 [Candidatus Uhrbacteria bacterium CG10_big_fil_rev_8_21_14_0_10_48_11]|uniref:AB hydrolase-1 domain-containing protein n=1 Tax=Candidatus Uhrbacteria bacterium CG10_big_fil_rev_8_21_14_0_10_48_11 TaxID=1975037 RepID=A0A2M8LFA7_9BACT|nr:MAG: hypothetical protein COV04_01205 [Candidatus Uhrbacteria bacterium CG10_big_fil_rev_8_21_14_0_10_48_11]